MANSQTEGEVHIHYVGFKPDHTPFTNEEILALNVSFIRWAEAENLRVGGGIGPYPEKDESPDSTKEHQHETA